MVSLDLYLLSSRYLSDISLEMSVKQLCEFKLKGKRVPASNVYIWELSACHLYLKSELMSPLRERTEMEEATLWRTTERSVKEANWKGSEWSQEDRDQQLKGKGKVRCLGSQKYWGMMAQEGSKERTNWKDLKVGISNLELLTEYQQALEPSCPSPAKEATSRFPASFFLHCVTLVSLLTRNNNTYVMG